MALINGTSDSDTLTGTSDDDQIYGQGGDDDISGDNGEDTLFGGAGDDRVAGNRDIDTIYGGADDDLLLGQQGDDFLYGDDGTDELRGAAGADNLFGGNGDDILEGGRDSDLLDGGSGNDLVDYSDASSALVVNLATGSVSGDDDAVGDTLVSIESVLAGRRSDTITGDDGDNRFYGGAGGDLLYGAAGDDFLSGMTDGDRLFGGQGNDRLYGGAANDELYGGDGADVLDGGDGIDRVDYSASSSGVTVNLLAGAGSGGSAEGDTLASIEVLSGSAFDDLLIGAGADDLLSGADGDDVLRGETGDDTLYGGADSDNLKGGAAIDSLYGEAGDDRLFGQGGADILFGGTGNDKLFGNGNGDTLNGGAGADLLSGGFGSDFLFGGTGADLLNGGPDNDALTGGLGQDTLLGGDGSDSLLAGEGDDILKGMTGNDQLSGNDGTDKLQGGAGDDYLVGGGGRDLLFGGAGADRFALVSASDSDASGAGRDIIRDFESGIDAIDFSGMDANELESGRNGFTFITGGFSGRGGEVRVIDQGDRSLIQADTNGDGNADTALLVFGDIPQEGDFAGLAASTLYLDSLTAEQGLEILYGVGGNAGFSNAAVGDVNGDELDDIIIGSPGANGGEAYVLFGSAAVFGSDESLDLQTLSASEGFIIRGFIASESIRAGFSVSGGSDVNGDGLDDLIVGAPYSDAKGNESGEAYVIFGSDSGFGEPVTEGGHTRQVIDLETLSANEGFVLQGAEFNNTGYSVAGLGDVNGDELDDILISGESFSAESYVIFGDTGGFGSPDGNGRNTVDLTSLDPADGFVIKGIDSDDAFGADVSSAGDINGDGIHDLMVSAPEFEGTSGNAGDTYVIFGSSEGFGSIDEHGRALLSVDDLDPEAGFVVTGDIRLSQLGSSISQAGDFNGDGFDDLILGTRYGDDGYGNAVIVFGSDEPIGDFKTVRGQTRQVLDADQIQSGEGVIFKLKTFDPFDNFDATAMGASVSYAGDVNGDGFDDVLIGAPNSDTGGQADTGMAYVVFGRENLGSELFGAHQYDLADLGPGDGFLIRGGPENDHLGSDVSAAGDINDDGYADLIIGGDGAYVIYGRADLGAPSAAGASVAVEYAEMAETLSNLKSKGNASAPPPEPPLANFSEAMDAALAGQMSEIAGRFGLGLGGEDAPFASWAPAGFDWF